MTEIVGQNRAVTSEPLSLRRGMQWWWLAGCVVLLVALRMHAFSAPLETDECNYAYIGQQLLAGDRLYVDVWDHQPPGIFALTAAVGAVFGFEPQVFRWLATVVAMLTLAGLVAIRRRHLGGGAVWLTAILFALASSDPGIAGEGCNREIYMNALGVAALYLVLRGGVWSLLLAGLSLGLSSLLKTVVAAQWLVMLLPILLLPKPDSLPAALKRVLWFALGPLMVWLVTFAYFAATHRLDAFVDATFTYNLDYGEVTVPIWRKLGAFFLHGRVFVPLLGLWIAGAVSLVIPLIPRGKATAQWGVRDRFALTIIAFAAGSFLAVCLPGKFWPHYYLLLLPSLVLGAVALYDCLPMGRVRHAYAGVILLATLGGQIAFYLSVPGEQVGLRRYGSRMNWARDHGRRIAQVTDPEDYVYVNSIDVGMYYYSHRRCSTRYTLATVLVGEDESAHHRRQNLLEDLRKRPPRLILLVPGLPYMAELDRFIRERSYVKVGEDSSRMLVLCDPKRMVADVNWDSRTAH